MLESLKIFSQNVHKNRSWTQHLLETLHDSYHVVLIQEPPYSFVKTVPSGTSKEGEDVFDTVHHPKWSKIYKNSNVSAYVSLEMLKKNNLFLAPAIDENILHFSLVRTDNGETTHIINCYNDPDKDTLSNLTK